MRWSMLALVALLSGLAFWLYCVPVSAQETTLVQLGSVQSDGSIAGVPTVAPGQEVGEVLKVVRELRAAASEKRWGLFVSILLMAVLALANTLLIRSQELRDKVKAYMGEVALAMALMGYIAVAVAALPPGAHVGDWWAVIWPALKTGFAAVGAYEILAKRLFGVYLPKLVTLLRRKPVVDAPKP